MASSKVYSLVAFAVLLLVACSHVGTVQAAAKPICPDYKKSLGCDMGPCSKAGVVGNFLVPATSLRGKAIKFIPGDDAERCFNSCKREKKCALWQWIKKKESKGQVAGECYLYPNGMYPECSASYTTTVGIKCGGSACHDPHFVGAHGTHYDFNGEPGKSFCLVSDLSLHMNMKMTGYLDDRTESASLLVGGKAVRTWIRELGILWMVEEEEHSLLLVARGGKETARGEGFLAKAEVDGEVIPKMDVGEEVEIAGGLTIKFMGIKKSGIFDIDIYSVFIDGLLDMTVHLRVAHPLLRRPDDAETHISIAINWIQTTPAIHGVLGQTYREGREERTEIYSKLGEALKHAISADGESGKGFLDGRPEDYVSSGVLKTDCRYSGFNGQNMPASAE